jgi:hypothetical protein
MSELVPQKDWPIAYALWAEGRSIEDAAAAAGMSPIRARIVRKRILKAIESILLEFSSSKISKKREVTMQPCELFQQFIADPTNKQIADQMRDRADELLEHLQDCEACQNKSEALESNLSAFYEALSATIEITEEDFDFEEYERATAEDDARVRTAIEDVLLPAVGDQFKDRLASIIEREDLFNLFLACEALSMRVHRHAWLEGRDNFVLMNEGLYFTKIENGSEKEDLLSRKTLLNEISAFTTIGEETDSLLLDWIIAASRSFPKLMLGIEATPFGEESLKLALFDRDPTVNLYEYWALSETVQNDKYKINELSTIKEAYKKVQADVLRRTQHATQFATKERTLRVIHSDMKYSEVLRQDSELIQDEKIKEEKIKKLALEK